MSEEFSTGLAKQRTPDLILKFQFQGCAYFRDSWLRPCTNRVFHEHTKLMLVLLPTLCVPYICSFLPYLHQLILVKVKSEIKEFMRITFPCYTSLDWLTFTSRAKTKLAMLAFLFCGEFVNNSIAIWNKKWDWLHRLARKNNVTK